MSSSLICVAILVFCSPSLAVEPKKAPCNTSNFTPSQLLKNYNALVAPQKIQSGGVDVQVRLGLKTLHHLDLPDQTLSLLAWFTLIWYDERLLWNTSVPGQESAGFQASMIWVPEVIIFNTLMSLDELVNAGRDLKVFSNGMITWRIGGIFKTFCSMDITYYPFDEHLCSVQLTTWTYSMEQINLTLLDPPFENDDFTDNSEWTFTAGQVSTFYSSSAPYKTLKFKFKVKRKVLFYVVNVLCPILLVSSINGFVLWLPKGTGEKMTVCLTSFITFLTYLKFTVDTLPRNSDTLCYFGLYLTVQLLTSVFTVTTAAATVWLGWRERLQNEATSSSDNDHSDPISDQSEPSRSGLKGKWINAKKWTQKETEEKTEASDLRLSQRVEKVGIYLTLIFTFLSNGLYLGVLMLRRMSDAV